jgi:hypothetical protein
MREAPQQKPHHHHRQQCDYKPISEMTSEEIKSEPFLLNKNIYILAYGIPIAR